MTIAIAPRGRMPRMEVRLDGDVNYAARRWAAAVVPAATAHVDLRTVDAWAKFIGASTGALRAWCRAAGERPKASLDFARLISAIRRAPAGSWDLMNALDIVDERTLRRLFKRCGLPIAATPPTVAEFIEAQRLIREPSNRDAIRALLDAPASAPAAWLRTAAWASCAPGTARPSPTGSRDRIKRQL